LLDEQRQLVVCRPLGDSPLDEVDLLARELDLAPRLDRAAAGVLDRSERSARLQNLACRQIDRLAVDDRHLSCHSLLHRGWNPCAASGLGFQDRPAPCYSPPAAASSAPARACPASISMIVVAIHARCLAASASSCARSASRRTLSICST